MGFGVRCVAVGELGEGGLGLLVREVEGGYSGLLGWLLAACSLYSRIRTMNINNRCLEVIRQLGRNILSTVERRPAPGVVLAGSCKVPGSEEVVTNWFGLSGRCDRTMLVVSCAMLFLFRVITCVGGEASGLGAPSLPTNASQREKASTLIF